VHCVDRAGKAVGPDDASVPRVDELDRDGETGAETSTVPDKQ